MDNSVATIEQAKPWAPTPTIPSRLHHFGAKHAGHCGHNINNSAIEQAINTAIANGVQCYIAEGQNANLGDAIDDSMPIHFRTDGWAAACTTSSSWATATTRRSLCPHRFDEFHHRQPEHRSQRHHLGDQSLARAYTLEFEEMWGSTGMSPTPP